MKHREHKYHTRNRSESLKWKGTVITTPPPPMDTFIGIPILYDKPRFYDFIESVVTKVKSGNHSTTLTVKPIKN